MPTESRPRRIDHCIVRPGRGESWCDGVMLEWFGDVGSLRANDVWRQGAGADAAAPVAGYGRRQVVVEERCAFGADWLQANADSVGPMELPLLIGLIESAAHLEGTEFRDYWWDHHRPLANSLVPPDLQPLAYVHNYVLEPTSFRWDGIGQMFERSLDTARARSAWFASSDAAPLIADEERFLIRDTRRVLLTDHEVVALG